MVCTTMASQLLGISPVAFLKEIAYSQPGGAVTRRGSAEVSLPSPGRPPAGETVWGCICVASLQLWGRNSRHCSKASGMFYAKDDGPGSLQT